MCFAPQRRTLFRRLNFKKCLESFNTFDFEMCFAAFSRSQLPKVLRATTACNFSSLISPDGSAPAALASLLVDPPEPQITGKAQGFVTILPFRAPASSFFWVFLLPFRAPASSFFWLFLFSDLLSSALLFSDSSHLCFSSVHIVGSLTSKCPSVINDQFGDLN